MDILTLKGLAEKAQAHRAEVERLMYEAQLRLALPAVRDHVVRSGGASVEWISALMPPVILRPFQPDTEEVL